MKQKIAVYENLLHALQHIRRGNNIDELDTLLDAVGAWSHVKKQGMWQQP